MNNEISPHWTLDEEKLAAFVLNKLNDPEISLLKAHLEKCSECQSRVQAEREIQSGIRRFGRLEMKRKLKLRLRRDQKRRFEWINVASLAAAIVIMLGGVFAVRWFIEIKQEKTGTREILLSETKESEHGKQALWIIGRVIETINKPQQDKKLLLADEYRRETKMEEGIQIKDIAGGNKKKQDKSDSTLKTQGSEYLAEINKEINVREPVNAPAAAPSVLSKNNKVELEKKDTSVRGSVASQLAANDLETRSIHAENAPASLPVESEIQERSREVNSSRTKVRVDTDSLAGVNALNITSINRPSIIAEAKKEQRENVHAKQKSLAPQRKLFQVKNIVVRRGNLKDLPASLSSGDIGIIQTKMERTTQGILLTFYSNSIKDSIATNVEAVSEDSIVVSFHKMQVGYYIPGGISKRM